jgi:hypothetical protein
MFVPLLEREEIPASALYAEELFRNAGSLSAFVCHHGPKSTTAFRGVVLGSDEQCIPILGRWRRGTGQEFWGLLSHLDGSDRLSVKMYLVPDVGDRT